MAESPLVASRDGAVAILSLNRPGTRNALNPDWRAPFNAASFAFQNKGAATNQEISDWLDKSLSINQNISNLWLKAQYLQSLGKTQEAIKAGEEAIAKASPQQADFANFIRDTIAGWKK